MSFNYIGSKKSLLDFIDIPISKIIKKYKKDIVMLDGFAGTGIVGMHFQSKYINVHVIANDLEYYSYIINFAQLCVPFTDKLKKIINTINSEKVQNKKNFNLISMNYSPKGESERMFWTQENAEKADYIKYVIDKHVKNNNITTEDAIFLNASLLSSMDKVANTASVYGAFLKKFKNTALQKLELKPIHTNETLNGKENKVYNNDINSDEIINQKYDIVYLDPPYNQRQYSSNYHPLNYIAKYDKDIEVYGKTGLLKDSNKSKYCQKKEAYEMLSHLVTNLKTTHIILSYNNEGIIEFDKIKELLTNLGKVILYMKPYKKFKSNEKQEDEDVYEYLFHLEKSDKKEFKIEKIDK